MIENLFGKEYWSKITILILTNTFPSQIHLQTINFSITVNVNDLISVHIFFYISRLASQNRGSEKIWDCYGRVFSHNVFETNLLNAFFREWESPGHRAGRRDVAHIVRHHHRVLLTLQQGHKGLHVLNCKREQNFQPHTISPRSTHVKKTKIGIFSTTLCVTRV